MDERHREYVEYYRVRTAKYDGSTIYQESARTEHALLDAFEQSATLEEAAEKVTAGNLATANAIALLNDQWRARLEVYEELEETVKAEAPRQVMAAVEGVTDVVDATSRVNRVLAAGAIAETADELHRVEFVGDLAVMEQLEVYRRAEIPDRWRSLYDAEIARTEQDGREVAAEVAAKRALVPDWKLDHDELWETRHRRRIPISDDALRARIEQHRALEWG
ncbi:MAG: hypothetical protein FJW86_12535 [Actinobacteria bacterium]|nr:hypothetical protein [Actinomycetota bacterium]